MDRIALNFDQVEEYDPPPNPAKSSDSRFERYEALHGDESWELDALPPNVLSTLIEERVEMYRDNARFEALLAEENEIKEKLEKASVHWNDVAEFLEDYE